MPPMSPKRYPEIRSGGGTYCVVVQETPHQETTYHGLLGAFSVEEYRQLDIMDYFSRLL